MGASFELFDHTADVGVRLYADSLEELPFVAAKGLYSVIGQLRGGGLGRQQSFEFRDDDPEIMLRDFLAELLYLFVQEGLIADAVEVDEYSDRALRVNVTLALVDDGASEFEREVKAVTYHDLTLQEVDGAYVAVFIVDI